MNSIFQISQDLAELFDQIELQDGELTSELEDKLIIKQAEFKDKINNYSNVIKQLDSDLATIKQEQDRLKKLQNRKEKLIDRLKTIMAEAITMYGDTSASGAKYIDCGTKKISVRNNTAIELDDVGLNQFMNRCLNCIRWHELNTPESELTDNDIIKYANNTEASTNFENKEELSSTVTQYSKSDIESMIADINFTFNINDAITKEQGRNLINTLLKYNSFIKIKPSISKVDIKSQYKASGTIPSFAKQVTHKNLIIK